MVLAPVRLTRKASILFLMLLTAGWVSLGLTVPCRARTAAVTPGQREAALAGARQVIQRAAGVTSNAAFADLFTQRSAVSLGSLFLALSGMSVSFNQTPGVTAGGVSPAKIKTDFGALMARWGMVQKADSQAKGADALAASIVAAPGVPVNSDGVPRRVEQSGRRFLVDVLTFMAEINPKQSPPWKNARLPSVSGLTYTVLSPTRVGLKMKKPDPKSQSPGAAVLEDGKWRLDLGNFGLANVHATRLPSP